MAPEILENTRHRKYTRAVDVWSLGVVLYICLCGFPPFSDELYSRDNPYTLAQQIKMGRFDYPSPYWDPVGDPALDLIDRMLTVDIEKRITIDDCLEHPWIRNVGYINPADSTDGLSGAMRSLDFSKRKVQRERTLLANINDVKISKVIEISGANLQGQADKIHDPAHVKVWQKNVEGKRSKVNASPKTTKKDGNVQKLQIPEDKVADSATSITATAGSQEEHPAANRQEEEFLMMGGKGDMQLFSDDANSRYLPEEVPKKGKGKGKTSKK